ncbi:MAG: bifunctional phosphoribosylaminoimidazolecarboxamide formyltransferase/IMP cyclohydrolase [Candidatus Omnitrophica bacterium]|nr:bifunctional phosphoribosylaminoimidazolecarboxamide formyltransferase/IMP cyclohydrolase [Candidatus Omnitrophota bacterium]
MVRVKRALLSCYDKTGLDVFAKALASLGVELVASSGTAEFLAKQGLRVTTVEDFAGITEQLDGRVKTLHPKIHAGILARRDDPAHLEAVGERGLIDLVVVNLYPFEETVQRPGASLAEALEQIDIGGVALLRAAAKNFAHVAVIAQPQQYPAVAEALRADNGRLPEALTRQLAMTAFSVTSAYDTRISAYLSSSILPEPSAGRLSEGRSARSGTAAAPPTSAGEVWLNLRRRQGLRYGENPHQQGAWYVAAAEPPWGIGTLSQLQGKELSYNNLLDIDAALRCLLDLEEPACAIMKHHSPCGVASAPTIQQAYERAYACDAESAFGGVVGVNRPLDVALAEQLTTTFLEVIMAPSVEPSAAALLAKKANLRVVSLAWPSALPSTPEWRSLSGSWLQQEPDRVSVETGSLRVVTKRAPLERERADLLFAWKAAKHVKSNGIVLARDRATVGIGQGQPSRVGSVRLAIERAGKRSHGAVVASDGFFPFPDSVELLAQAGISAVIQPGGSLRDAEVVEAADRANLAMLVTGIRHFRH